MTLRRVFRRRTLGRLLLYLFLSVVAIITLLPLAYAFFGSFKSVPELFGNARLLPTEWRFENYARAWERANFSRYFFNSLLVTGTSTVLNLIIVSMLGYALARKRLPGFRWIEAAMIATIFLGIGTIMLYPRVVVAQSLGLFNLYGLIIVETAGGLALFTLLIKAFVRSIPGEIYEAATMDGTSFFGAFWHIALPIMRPILATVVVLSFTGTWNNFQEPFVFTLAQPQLRTLTVGLYQLRVAGETVREWNVMLAGAMLGIIPVVVIFLFCQNYFIRGLTGGAVKG
jgi:ABC-type glycerol-3-phosphate transport system permease component